jgi:hypothetical protein
MNSIMDWRLTVDFLRVDRESAKKYSRQKYPHLAYDRSKFCSPMYILHTKLIEAKMA